VLGFDALPATHPIDHVTLNVFSVAVSGASGGVGGSGLTQLDGTDSYGNVIANDETQYNTTSLQTSKFPVIAGTFVATWGILKFGDDGSGNMTSPNLPSGWMLMGNVAYATGAWSVTVNIGFNAVHGLMGTGFSGGPVYVQYGYWGLAPSGGGSNVQSATGVSLGVIGVPLQQFQLTGQPTRYTVTVEFGGVYQFKASRNDLLGDSNWSAAQTVDLTVPSITGSGDTLQNGNFTQWGNETPHGNQTVGVPLGWFVAENSSRGYTTNPFLDTNHPNSVGLNVGSLVDANNFVGLRNQTPIGVAAGQTHTLAFNVAANPAISTGLRVRLHFIDQYQQNDTYVDAVANIPVGGGFASYSLAFVVPQVGATFVAVNGKPIPIPQVGVIDFVPLFFAVEFLNYNPNVSSTVYIQSVTFV
jgi:hypothetical protein